MEKHYFYALLLCFFSGITLCQLIVYFIVIVLKYNKYQFQRAFAATLLMLAVGFLDNFIMLACRNISNAEYINTLLLLYDYLVIGCFMIFAITLVHPNRYKIKQLLLIELPYLTAFILYATTPVPAIYPAVQIYTIATSTLLAIWLLLSIKKHNRMLTGNSTGGSTFEYLNLRWIATLVVLMYAVQLIWAIESLSQKDWFTSSNYERNLVFDTIWCLITIIYIYIIYKRIIQQQVTSFQTQEKTEQENTERLSQSSDLYYKILTNTDIDKNIRENKYYLDEILTLQKLATLLGTNRQYLSNYINREKQKTFYEYINEFRLEEAKSLLDGYDVKHPYSMEEISSLAGFNSYSTFLRSFVKKYGISPSKYLKNKNSSA